MGGIKVLSNFLWRFLERVGAKGVSFVVSIVLARLLMPEAYATIALVTVFTSIINVFVDSGLGNALIQKKDADDLDFSSVFYFNMAMCLALYGVMYVISPLIASFYNKPELILITRVLSLTLVISGLKNVQQAYVSRTMQFKRFFFATLGGTLVSAILGIWMAYLGYGVWSLVIQNLSNTIIDTLILWITVKWRPKLMFSFSRLKSLLSFGWKILISSLIDAIYYDLRQLIIGKLYTSADLAQYNKGKEFPNLVISNINTAIDSVLLPSMSQVQDDKESVKSMTRRSLKISTYIISPMMLGLVACGNSFILLLLTEKWLPCVPYMRIFCLTYMFYPMHTANLNAIKAMGRSDIFLKLEVIKKIVGFTALFLTMYHGVMAMAYSLLATTIIAFFINAWPNVKLLNYSIKEQLVDILPNVIVAIVMTLMILPIEALKFGALTTMSLQILSGVVIYVALSIILKLESFSYMLSIIKKVMKRN